MLHNAESAIMAVSTLLARWSKKNKINGINEDRLKKLLVSANFEPDIKASSLLSARDLPLDNTKTCAAQPQLTVL